MAINSNNDTEAPNEPVDIDTVKTLQSLTSIGEEEDNESLQQIENHKNKRCPLPWNIVEEPPYGSNKKELYPLEGSWRLVANQNYDKYLSAVGVTPLMAQMVLRSDFMVTIYEDIDKCWKILAETSIKAKSIRGYRCRNYKMIANKFMVNEPKPELLEDWDPRLVVTTVTFADDKLTLAQEAEKDQKFCKSSTTTFVGVDDVLTITHETEDGIKAVRKFVRHHHQEKPQVARKISAPF